MNIVDKKPGFYEATLVLQVIEVDRFQGLRDLVTEDLTAQLHELQSGPELCFFRLRPSKSWNKRPMFVLLLQVWSDLQRAPMECPTYIPLKSINDKAYLQSFARLEL